MNKNMEQLMGKIDDIITENDEELTKDPNEPKLIDELRLIERGRHEDSQISWVTKRIINELKSRAAKGIHEYDVFPNIEGTNIDDHIMYRNIIGQWDGLVKYLNSEGISVSKQDRVIYPRYTSTWNKVFKSNEKTVSVIHFEWDVEHKSSEELKEEWKQMTKDYVDYN